MSKLKQKLNKDPYLKIAFYVVLTVGIIIMLFEIITNISSATKNFFSFSTSILSTISPLIYGLLLAYLLFPISKAIEKHVLNRIVGKHTLKKKGQSIKKAISVLLTYLLVITAFFAILLAIYIMTVGQINFKSVSATKLLDNFFSYFNQYKDFFSQTSKKFLSGDFESLGILFQGNIGQTISKAFSSGSHLTQSFIDAVSSVTSRIISITLGMVISFYILLDPDFFSKLWDKTLDICAPKRKESIKHLFTDINRVISNFLRGQLLDALIVGILSSIGLTIIGLKFSILIGTFAGIANIIPYFGPLFGMIAAALVAFISGDYQLILLSVIILFAIQQLDSNFISPKVVGNATGLHPVFILLAVLIGGKILGVLGMLIAVPIASIIQLLIFRVVKQIEQKREKQKQTNVSLE